jgi:hypothetical protein
MLLLDLRELGNMLTGHLRKGLTGNALYPFEFSLKRLSRVLEFD